MFNKYVNNGFLKRTSNKILNFINHKIDGIVLINTSLVIGSILILICLKMAGVKTSLIEYIIGLVVSIFICYFDYKEYTIYNTYIVIMILAGLYLNHSVYDIVVAIVIFSLYYIFFKLGGMGGGDIKLTFATIILFGSINGLIVMLGVYLVTLLYVIVIKIKNRQLIELIKQSLNVPKMIFYGIKMSSLNETEELDESLKDKVVPLGAFYPIGLIAAILFIEIINNFSFMRG